MVKRYETTLLAAEAVKEYVRLLGVQKDLHDGLGNRKDIISSLYLKDSDTFKEAGVTEAQAFAAVGNLVHDRLKDRIDRQINHLMGFGLITSKGEWIDE